MMIELTDTNSVGDRQRVRARPRRAAGSPAMGMVLTLIVVVDEATPRTRCATPARRPTSTPHGCSASSSAARGARRRSTPRSAPEPAGAGRPRCSGSTASWCRHADSVVLPLLLPDSPVVVWWPSSRPPTRPPTRSGALAKRRITDAAEVPAARPRRWRCSARRYVPGNTDLAWTRLTPWRALLAAALDQHPAQGHRRQRWPPSGSTRAPTCSPRGCATGCTSTSTRTSSSGPGITEVVHGDQGGADPDRAARRPAGDVHRPRPARPADRAQAAATCPSCWPRSCDASTRTTSTPRPSRR